MPATDAYCQLENRRPISQLRICDPSPGENVMCFACDDAADRVIFATNEAVGNGIVAVTANRNGRHNCLYNFLV